MYEFLKVPKKHLTGAAKWKDIEDLINRWAKRDPKGAYQLEKWLTATREGLYDKKNAKWDRNFDAKYGKVSPDMKLGLLIHPDLEAYILAFYPDMFSTKESMHEFMRHFPKFTMPRANQ